MKHSLLAVLVVAGATLAAGSVAAQQESIAGDWTFTVEHFGLKLTLDQKKSTVTGTLDWPHGDPIKLTGAIAGERFVFFGGGAGENFTMHLTSTGSRKPDGTLAGTLKVHFDEFNDTHQVVRVRDQDIPWTASRGLHDVVHIPR